MGKVGKTFTTYTNLEGVLVNFYAWTAKDATSNMKLFSTFSVGEPHKSETR